MTKYILLIFFLSTTYGLDKIGRPLILKSDSSSQFHLAEESPQFKTINNIFSKKVVLNSLFPISDSFNIRAKFWLYIYAVLPSSSVIIHNKSDLSIIYKQLNFEKLWKSKLNILDYSVVQTDVAQKEVTKLKKSIMKLCISKNFKKDAESIHPSLVTDLVKPCNYYIDIANNLRLQTGKKDISYSSLERYYNLKPFLTKLHSVFKTPEQIDAIAFLESNFIAYAHSHAGAYGIWQFMKRTGNYFFPKISSDLDFRANPYTATLGAYHLLKQNHQILNSWELAIPAYNFGVNQILLAKKALKKKNLSLDYLFKNYTSTTLGFASKNYYANFLAAATLIKYHNKFDLKKYKPKKNNIQFYLTKCSLRPSRFYSLFKNKSKMRKLNSHILNANRIYKKGLLIVSNQNLTSRRYLKLSYHKLRRIYPKNFYKLVRGSNCN